MKIHKNVVNWFTGVNLLGILIMSNILLGFIPAIKFDLTKDKIYTLSEASRNIIKKLPDRVDIDVYLSSNLPSQYKPAADDLRLILDEIGRVNPGKLTIKFFDPTSNELVKEEAQKAGVNPIQFNQVNNDKFEISEGYLGMVVNYTDKKEVIPVVGNVENLEYALLGTISNLVTPKVGNIALSVVGAQSEEGDGFMILRTVMGRVFPQINEINLEESTGPGENDLAWVIVMSQGSIGGSGVELIDKWQKSGKPILLLVDQLAADNNAGSTPNTWGPFNDWLKKQGVEVQSKLVADMQSNAASVRTPDGNLLTQYWYWPVISRDQMNQSIPAVSGVDNLSLFWASPLKIEKTFKNLISSSKQAWAVDASGNLSPNSIVPPQDSEMSQQTLAAIRTEGGRMVVIGDTDWLKDTFLPNNRAGLTTIFNLLDFVTANESMIEIRTKNISYHPLPNWSKETKNIYRAANLGIPLFLILAGAGSAWIIRKKFNEFK
jgi:ABC-type uncharacterized transport system involved in gliding motility auxiliary subunit